MNVAPSCSALFPPGCVKRRTWLGFWRRSSTLEMTRCGDWDSGAPEVFGGGQAPSIEGPPTHTGPATRPAAPGHAVLPAAPRRRAGPSPAQISYFLRKIAFRTMAFPGASILWGLPLACKTCLQGPSVWCGAHVAWEGLQQNVALALIFGLSLCQRFIPNVPHVDQWSAICGILFR